MEMNQQNQVSNSLTIPDVTVKKKRGRPKKDPSLYPPKPAYVPKKRILSQHYSESAPVPPGFEEENGSHPRPVDAVNDNSTDSMIGQSVVGVIEAVFDAGYLLSVRVGDSDTCLRGVVFKSGHYVPVSAENDLAPGLPMIKRNVVPIPVGNQTQKLKPRGRKRNDQLAVYQSNGGSPASSQVSSVRARELAIVPAQPPRPDPLESRGLLVPVLLQPVKLSNGAMPPVEVRPVASQPAHLAASRRKLVIPSHVVPEISPRGSETYSGLASRPFEELVSAANNLKGSPHSADFQNDSAKSFPKMLPNYSGLTQEEADDFSKPLYVEPLQAIHSGLGNRSAPMLHPFSERSTGKMTELLLAVQENLKERQHQELRNREN